MRYANGTVTEEQRQTVAIGKSTIVAAIKGTLTITTTRNGEFTLYRIDQRTPARFYMTHRKVASPLPVLGASRPGCEEPYEEFEIAGEVVTEGDVIRLIASDGSYEDHCVRRFDTASPPHIPPGFMRNGRRCTRAGHTKNSRCRSIRS